MIQDKKRNEILYPVRVIAKEGNVAQTENLFIKKELVVTFNETRVASLEKCDETPTWLVLDFGKELHGGVRIVTPYVEKKTAKLRLVFGESVSEALSAVGEKGATNDHAPRDIEVIVSNFSALEFGQTGFRFVKIELLDTDNAAAFLETNGAQGFTTFMSYFLLRAMSEVGSRYALNVAKTYYGGMLDRGATSFWEDFDIAWLEGSGRIDEIPNAGEKDLHGDYGAFCYKGLRHSFCHGWSSGIVGFAYEKLLGLQILEAGYKKVRFAPNLMGLAYVEGKIPTPYGEIEVKITPDGAQIKAPQGVAVVE